MHAYVNEAPAELLFVTEKMSVLLRKNIIDFNIWKDSEFIITLALMYIEVWMLFLKQ